MRAAFLCSLWRVTRGSASAQGSVPEPRGVGGRTLSAFSRLSCKLSDAKQSVRLLLLLLFGKSNDQAKLLVLHAYFLSGLCQSVGPRNLLVVL